LRNVGDSGDATDPLQEYRQQCSAGGKWSLDCEYLRGVLAARTALALETIEHSHDQRGVPLAMKALDLLDEPTVLIGACRVLGEFADTPGLAEKVLPLLDSPYFEVQQIAASLIGKISDPAINTIAYQWSSNHGGVSVEGPYDELDFPDHYDGMGFPEYPGMERYTPADSDRSIAWWTPDPAATVSTRLAGIMGVQPLGYEQWSARVQQQMMTAVQGAMDPAKVAEIEKLTEQYVKKQDAEIMERIQKLQQEMMAPMEQASANSERAIDNVAVPSGSAPIEQVHYFIAEEKDDHVARMVLVYRQPGVERTVIQMSWNLRDYPPAWGDAAEAN
jgi:hypothetical protein